MTETYELRGCECAANASDGELTAAEENGRAPLAHASEALAKRRGELGRLSPQLLVQLLDTLPNAVAIFDDEDRLVYCNQQYRICYDRTEPAIDYGERYETILRYALKRHQFCVLEAASEETDGEAQAWIESFLKRRREEEYIEYIRQLSSGRWIKTYECRTEEGFTIVAATDISALKLAESRVRRQAETDPLTGLLNRASFLRYVDGRLGRRRADDPCCGCFIYFDVDHFKSINDTLGHQAGDQLLRIMATRLREATRETDLLARIGGDEFALFLPLHDLRFCDRVVRKIHAALTEPAVVDGHEITPGVSMGVTTLGNERVKAGELMRRADTALYMVKNQGRNGWRYFDKTLQRRFERRRQLAVDMHEAIARDAFEIALQPQVSLQDGEHVGFEVLARWRRGGVNIAPGEFIPVAEDSGLIFDISCQVVKKALAWLNEMKARGLRPGRMALNISPLQLKCQNFIERLEKVLARHGVEPYELELEVTETALIGRDEEMIARTLHCLAEMGFMISLDDFGTGNASFMHLKVFPIHRLKIDKRFIDDIGGNPDNTIISKAIIGLAHDFDMEVVAEGVETKEQCSYLRITGCDIGQGYLFSRPLTPSDAEKWLKSCSGTHDAEMMK